MPYSKVEICNAALQRIGVENIISSLSDGSSEAQVINLHYDMALDSMLRSFPWRFAMRTSVLVEAAGVSHPLWTYAYGAPANMLKVMRIISDSTMIEDTPIPYDLQSYPNGWVLFTNMQDAWAEYIYKAEDPGLWDSSFQEAFTLKLASVIALPLTASDSKTQDLTRLAQFAWQNAISMSASETRNTYTRRERYQKSRR